MTTNDSAKVDDVTEQCSSGTEREETKWSPAGFEAPDPELTDEMVVCAGCGELSPASEMGVTGDNIIRNGDDEVIEVTRRYIHNNEDCMMALITGGSQ